MQTSSIRSRHSSLLLLAFGAALLWFDPIAALAEGATVPLPAATQGTSTALGERLATPAPLIVEGMVLDRAPLAAIYAARGNMPIWEGRADWPTDLAAATAGADREGIPPESLGLAALQRALADPALGPAERDLFLTDRFVGYAAILARGRVDLAAIENLWALPAPVFDPLAAIAALESAGPAAALQQLAPATPGYDRLRGALARYEALAALGGWESLPGGTKLLRGDQGPLVLLLRRRLAAEGDLAAGATEDPLFDAGLEAAVGGFQSRHGLLVDGHVGPATLAALDLTAADRARQIRVNLERLRAMPHALPPTRIAGKLQSAAPIGAHPAPASSGSLLSASPKCWQHPAAKHRTKNETRLHAGNADSCFQMQCAGSCGLVSLSIVD